MYAGNWGPPLFSGDLRKGIHDRPIKVLGTEGKEILRRGYAGETNPMGLTYAVAIRYKGPGPNEPNPVNLHVICRLPRKSARFRENLNAHDLSRIPRTPYIYVEGKATRLFKTKAVSEIGRNKAENPPSC